jgi:hypothetical protein
MSKTGQSEYDRFVNLTDRILSVPKKEILRREAEYKRQSALNVNRRGPKPKIKTSASGPGPAVS